VEDWGSLSNGFSGFLIVDHCCPLWNEWIHDIDIQEKEFHARSTSGSKSTENPQTGLQVATKNSLPVTD